MSEATGEERAARIADLATGFALGELDEGELRELYEALRAEGGAGAAAARVAWQVLGATIDLKAQLGSAFQDELLMKLHAEAGGDQASARAFTDRLRARLGQARPGLAAVASPPPPPAGRRAALVVAGLAGALIAAAAVAWWAWPRRDAAVARVAVLHGGASQGERALTPGAGVDRRPLTVPDGTQLSLAWPGGGRATVAGPAGVVAGPGSLALLAGRAWISAGPAGFAIALPDQGGPVRLSADGRAAIEVRDGRSLMAVGAGSLTRDDAAGAVPMRPGRAWRQGTGYDWYRRPLAAGDSVPVAGTIDWRLTGTLQWSSPDAHLHLRLACADGRGLDLHIGPGTAVLTSDGVESQRLALPGAPLAPRALAIDGDEAALRIAIAGVQLLARPPAAPLSLGWTAAGDARLADAVLRTGPEAEPPLPER